MAENRKPSETGQTQKTLTFALIVMHWFLYDRDLRHKRVKQNLGKISLPSSISEPHLMTICCDV